MKKLTIVLVAALISFSGFAKTGGENYYIVTTGEQLSCKKISFGKEYTKVVLENGEKVLVNTNDIKMYRLNGKIFEKLPVYTNNQKTNKNEFMQFVATRAGLRLYKYSNYEEAENSNTGAYLGVQKVDHYVVFKGDQLHVEVTDKNYETIFDFFHINYIK